MELKTLKMYRKKRYFVVRQKKWSKESANFEKVIKLEMFKLILSKIKEILIKFNKILSADSFWNDRETNFEGFQM